MSCRETFAQVLLLESWKFNIKYYAKISKWGKKYLLVVVNHWGNYWTHSLIFFKYPKHIRKIIYTTNALGVCHWQLRKVTKNQSAFPNDEVLVKILYLAIQDVMKKWTMPRPTGLWQFHSWLLCINNILIWQWYEKNPFTQIILQSL